MNRRTFFTTAAVGLAGLSGAGLAYRAVFAQTAASGAADGQGAEVLRRLGFLVQSEGPYEWDLSEDEWRARLTAEQFRVLRQEGTERARTSPLDKFYEAGTYHCQGCDLPVYSSTAKYDSGTGWPSFWAPIEDNAIRVKSDSKLWAERTEVHCRRCGGHFGHIFRDGPAPTGLRHCLNGVSLRFEAA